MLCSSPVSVKGALFGCGQCIPCRVNRRRVWTHRLMLEAAQQKDNAFVTLTYSDESLEHSSRRVVGADGVTRYTLVPGDLRDFLKRFRKALEPHRIRFFAAGEYGDQTQRPHYHLAVFGYPSCPDYGSHRSDRSRDSCPVCGPVQRAWDLGLVDVGDLSESSAAYVAGYVLKKMTGADDIRLLGRHPEFSRMSNRPGIGAGMMDEVASTMMMFDLDQSEGDVPSALRHGQRMMPLGRYLRRRLRERLGRDPSAPADTLQIMEAEMQSLREDQFSRPKASLRQVYQEKNLQKIRSVEGKQKLKRKRSL